MHLYSLTLQQPTAINKAIVGNYSGNPKVQEILVSKGKILELLRVDEKQLNLTNYQRQIICCPVLGDFWSCEIDIKFQTTWGTQLQYIYKIKHDFIIVLSDSGRIVLLEYEPEKNIFNKVHQETYGKSGCRRIVPGQYIAVDPSGRACMIGAIEKQKFVYILNQENTKMTISSPLEAHKSHSICYDMVGLDTQFQNAQFACIESDYGDPLNKDSSIWTGQVTKMLMVYLLDLGLNNVFKHSQDPIPESAHMLISIAAQDAPGGLVVLCEDFLIYKNGTQMKTLYYPKRVVYETFNFKRRPVMVNCYGFHKQKDLFFYILQTELGDLLKLSFNFTKEDVHSIQLSYFDTIPVANSLCILKKGYLFAPCDKGNHMFYKFLAIGDEQGEIKTDTTMELESQQQVYFCPRELKNLKVLDELQNLSVISDMKIEDLTGEGNSQIYALCAAGTRSSLRILRHGLSVQLMAQSPLPNKPTGIWTINQSNENNFSKQIVLSFFNQSLVLSISDKVVEVQDSGLELKRQTIIVQLLEDNNILQVIPNGIRHIKRDNNKQTIQNWQTEGKIVKATSNPRQLAIALQSNELIYFEVDSMGEINQIQKCQLESEIVCLDIGDIPEGRQRCKFLAVGLSNHTVRILSLDPDTTLMKLAVQALPASFSESVCLLEMFKENESNQEQLQENKESQLYLYVGMQNGILLRASVDNISGTLQDIRTRFLGTKPVKCFKYTVKKLPALLALSSRPWICYNYFGKYYNTPLSCDTLDYASIFNTQDCTEGIVAISQNQLKIMLPENFGELLNSKIIPTKYTPKKMIINQQQKNLFILESDYRVFPTDQKDQIKKKLYDRYGEMGQEALKVPESQVGTIFAPEGSWASCLRIFDPIQLITQEIIEFYPNEYPTCFSLMNFTGYEDQFLVLATVKNYIPYPNRQFSSSTVYIYHIIDNGRKLQLMHETPLEDMVYAVASWKGKLICSVGHNLRIYELGQKKLLKKAELKEINSPAINIQVNGDRIFCAEMADSIHVFKYKKKEQTFQELADDVLPRWITSFQVLDYHTIIATDKFENAFVSRIPLAADQDQEENPQLYKLRWEQGYLNGAPFKMEQICNFYIGELVSYIQKASLVSTGNEVMVYGTTMGSIGALYPFETKEDIDFFIHLELHLRIESQPLCGREHVTFRSYYGPCKAVIDGDLCEQFVKLNYSKQKVLAEELERNPQDVNKKLEEIRNKIL